MKILIVILVVLALISIASAESINVGNYTATFDMKQPHIIDNNSVIRTYYGAVTFFPNRLIPDIPLEEPTTVPLKNSIATFYLGHKNDYLACALIKDDSKNLYYPIVIDSTLNLTSTLDFLKSLKITKNEK
ncbi:MAG: hypothetical protein ABR985_15395 [Methanotrichaceae archaeon]